MIFFSHAGLRATALVDMATYFSFGAVETFLPLFLALQGIGPYLTGILFAVQVLIIAGTQPFFGYIADHFDKRIQIMTGLIILGSSVALIPFTNGFLSALYAIIMFGLGMSLSTVTTSAYVADMAQKEQIGASMGALSSTMDIRHSAGLLVTGILIACTGYMSGFFMSFLLAAGVSVVFAISIKDKK